MSTSLLWLTFGVREYCYVKAELDGGGVIYHLERNSETGRLIICGSVPTAARIANEQTLVPELVFVIFADSAAGIATLKFSRIRILRSSQINSSEGRWTAQRLQPGSSGTRSDAGRGYVQFQTFGQSFTKQAKLSRRKMDQIPTFYGCRETTFVRCEQATSAD